MHLLVLVAILATIICLPSLTTPSSVPVVDIASRLLLLDVDNTLYEELYAGIESQIVSSTQHYCKNVLGIEKEMADHLYNKYGSTVEGLRQTIWKDESQTNLQKNLKEFFRAVYDNVNPSILLLGDGSSKRSSTGYSHVSDTEIKLGLQLLKSSPFPLALASNSPSWHVHNVLEALGLAKLLRTSGIFTPDRLNSFPSKHQPEEFFSAVPGDDNSKPYFNKHASISFLDDSLYNLRRVQQAFPGLVHNVHHINRKTEKDNTNGKDLNKNHIGESRLVQALLQEFGLIDPDFYFSQTQYLESKNKVDRQSLHAGTWNKVVRELTTRLIKYEHRHNNRTGHGDYPIVGDTSLSLCIVDLGAGLFSILDLILNGDDKLGLNALVSGNDSTSGTSLSSQRVVPSKTIHYIAYESNQELYRSCHARLLSWGFNVVDANVSNDSEESDIVDYQKDQDGIRIQVKLILRNFAADDNDNVPKLLENTVPDLIVGCCFADLMDPEKLVPDLIRTFGMLKTTTDYSFKNTLIYFPITFTGSTQLLPPQPFEFQPGGEKNGRTIPSDTTAFKSYSKALETVLGHNLDPYRLQDVMEDYGYNLINFGSSDWNIDPQSDSYLYETMLYFFGSTGGPQLLKEGWDATGWIQRARRNKPTIHVTNRDFLFQKSQMSSFGGPEKDNCPVHSREIVFTEPYKVTTIKKDLPSQLGPQQVMSKSCFLYSVLIYLVCNGGQGANDLSIQKMYSSHIALINKLWNGVENF